MFDYFRLQECLSTKRNTQNRSDSVQIQRLFDYISYLKKMEHYIWGVNIKLINNRRQECY